MNGLVVNSPSPRRARGRHRRPRHRRTASFPPPAPDPRPAFSRSGLDSFLMRDSFSSRTTAFSSVCRSARMRLGVDGLDVGCRGDRPVDVHHVAVLERAPPGDRVCLTDVRQELVAQPLPHGRTTDDAGDVDEGDGGGEDLLGPEDLGEAVEPLVGQWHHADVGVDRRERVVRRQHAVLREGVEHGRLADVRETDDSDGECHEAESLPASPGHPVRRGAGSAGDRFAVLEVFRVLGVHGDLQHPSGVQSDVRAGIGKPFSSRLRRSRDGGRGRGRARRRHGRRGRRGTASRPPSRATARPVDGEEATAVTRRPSSSSISRSTQAAGDSPGSTTPPGSPTPSCSSARTGAPVPPGCAGGPARSCASSAAGC